MSLSVEEFRELALTFDEAVELPHFHLTSFRIRKKIFATILIDERLAMVALTPLEQSLFTDGDAIRPVRGAWGAKGATHFDLDRVGRDVLEHALRLAYCGKAPKALSDRWRD
jgi:hypothetical protein